MICRQSKVNLTARVNKCYYRRNCTVWEWALPQTRRYKRVERNVVQMVLHFFARIAVGIVGGFKRLFRAGNKKMTIMIVPHSQEKVLNFQTNVFAIVFGVVIILGAVGAFLFLNKTAFSASAEIARLQNENKQTRAGLEELRDENNNLLQAAKKFQGALSQTMSQLGITQQTKKSSVTPQSGDLATLFDYQEYSGGTLKETSDIKQLTSYLEGAVQPIEEIGKMLETQGALFADIPSVWPLRGGIGHVSMAFGQNIHPITGQWYIHKGMDFSTYRSGDPIIATANGQVVTVGYDSGYGNYLIVKHKHGFYTRYAHLSTMNVSKGQFVSQGDTIGRIGNTGISTGPHLHYEVHIGSDVVDPAKYVNVTYAK